MFSLKFTFAYIVTCLVTQGKKFVDMDDEDDDIIDICDGNECMDMGDEQHIRDAVMFVFCSISSVTLPFLLLIIKCSPIDTVRKYDLLLP
jgi:hypothetical protein